MLTGAAAVTAVAGLIVLLKEAAPSGGGEVPKPEANAGPQDAASASSPTLTEHGKQRIIENSRGDGGVSDEALSEAHGSGTKIDQKDGTTMHVGTIAVIITNSRGEILTGWPTNSAGRRFAKPHKNP